MQLAAYKRLVIKIGSALLVEDGALRTDWLAALARDLATLRSGGQEIVLVSSGAIALGRTRLGLRGTSLSLAQKQASAAAGQSHLTMGYETALAEHGLMGAQALLTLDDTEDRARWLNARATLKTLLEFGTIPIINENDTVATDEIRYGDNDRLAARTASMIGADGLVLLSDIDGLYSSDPRTDASAKHLPLIEQLSDEVMAMGGGVNLSSGVGSGGMATKLLAAKIAVRAGCDMIITDGRAAGALGALSNGAKHTVFKAATNPKNARRQWIAGHLKIAGRLHIDDGAARALGQGKSLLAAGVTDIQGNFARGDLIEIMHDGVSLAKGLASYPSDEMRQIMGLKSSAIIQTLGYDNGAAVIHRDNLVIL